jgi:hypothetical protein
VGSVGYPSSDDDTGPLEVMAYCHALDKIDQNPREFDTSKRCLICKETGHTFANCKLLNDKPSLKQHRIMVESFLSRLESRRQKDLESLGRARISQVDIADDDEWIQYETENEDEEHDPDFPLGRE